MALALAVVAFLVVATSSVLAGAAPMSVVTRGVIAFVVFGVFGLVALRGVVRRVIGELAAPDEDKPEQQEAQKTAPQTDEQHTQNPSTPTPE